MDSNQTGQTLRRLRVERGLSFGELAALLFCERSHLSNIEAGRRWPKERAWAERADRALNGNGVLTAAWDADQQQRTEAATTLKLLEKARRESEALVVAPDGVHLDDIHDDIVHIARASGIEAYDRTIRHALDLRAELMRRLREGAHRPDTIRDLYVALSRVCGVLAYLTLDLGQADMAQAHIRAAFQLGDRAEHDQLRAWARGTQSLAFRFTKDFELARDAAIDGLRFVGASTGTAEPRLLCGLAASTANLGDSGRAVELLEQADKSREHCGPDEINGPLFGFSPAKQLYYHGFSLMWADDPAILRRAVKASHEAIAAWRETNSPGDEMLTYIYLATACARLGDLDGSIEAVAPILERPVTASFSWVKKRMNQLDKLLGMHFPNSRVADDMRETLQAYVHAA
ncbi:helix-turn-helix domain-containing protein [Nocardia arthritidis]|uniref:Helix-turn-helix domain-containing protein n=1 Tax=Nocardia arthritidis TaxID=228602 RepID=A0A6G9Y4T4_9NOCA|nr:helix-turn-helix domain-containing protein [Nocardia arthritidis]QIS08201.1 helix-turn-helix domain-containing protein [Nocardia arthritidis]